MQLFVMMCSFSVSRIFPQVMKVSVRSLNILTNHRSSPDSVHVLYINMEFLATKRRCEEPNWLVVLRCRLSSSFVELKGREYVANAVALGINTCFCICFSRLWRRVMTNCNQIIIMEGHPNKIYTSCFGSIKAGVQVNRGEIWSNFKKELLGLKWVGNATRQLTTPKESPRLVAYRLVSAFLILHFKFQFSKSIKSSTFHIFLNLTCPLRKKSF